MCSAKNGTPKSSWLCLLLMYQGAPVAVRRHLDWRTCNVLTWLRADLQMERVSCLYSRTPFLNNRPLLLFRRGPGWAELNIATRRNTARWGRSFRTLFGIPFGPGALPTLRRRVASWTSGGVGWLGFACRSKRVCSQHLVNRLNNCRILRLVYRL
jgi:hypothetical protein